MIEIRKYTADNQEVWNDFIAKSKNGFFMFNRNFMDYHTDRFVDNSLMFFEDNELIALLPLNIKENILYSHGGLTFGGIITNISMKAGRMVLCFDALKVFLQENNIHKIIYKKIPYIYENYPSDEDLYALFINGAKLFRRDVSTTIDLRNPLKMPKGRKAQISRARKEGVIIEKSHNFEEFVELENSVLKKHQAQVVHTAAELDLLQSRFPENIKLFAARQEGELIASALVFVYANMIHTQYMASSELGREIGALDLLISTLIDMYKDKQYFDFGISTENNGQYLNLGLCAQKESFGGRTVVYDFYEWNLK